MKSDDVQMAIETFVRGFSFTRSRTHPYLAEIVQGIHVMRDGPRRGGKGYRNEEWVAQGVPPARMHQIAHAHTRGRYALCCIRRQEEPDEPVRAEFKRLNYRLGRTEPFMVHPLTRIPKIDSPAAIERVRTRDMADRLGKATRSRPMRDELLAADAPLRQYVALAGEELVGWVASINGGAANWVSNMYVRPSHRRRGIGKALLARMLRDDRSAGAARSVLLSSHTGAMLYPVVGYQQIGELMLFTPRKR